MIKEIDHSHYTPPAESQGKTGTCTVFSFIELFETEQNILNGTVLDLPDIDLSRRISYWLFQDEDFKFKNADRFESLDTKGLEPENFIETYGSNPQDVIAHFKDVAIYNNARVSRAYGVSNGSRTAETIYDILAGKKTAGLQKTLLCSFRGVGGDIIEVGDHEEQYAVPPKSFSIAHSVLLVGILYDKERQCWYYKLKNSSTKVPYIRIKVSDFQDMCDYLYYIDFVYDEADDFVKEIVETKDLVEEEEEQKDDNVFSYDYYDIMQKEVGLNNRVFSHYDLSNKLEADIKALVELGISRALLKIKQ